MSDSEQPILVSPAISAIDPRLKQLSYSSVLTLHSCPRKFQLYRSSVAGKENSPSQNLTFAFGHMVGTGIQDILMEKSFDETLLAAFLAWPIDILEENEKQHKSFWVGVGALRRFHAMRVMGRLKDYELVTYEGKPAIELSFAIHLPDGFVYRGFVDAVLRHKHTGKVLVLENKTTGSKNVAPAMYKNSFQAIGYSIVLDKIFPGCSSYEVLYLIYQTWAEEFLEMPFTKNYTQRARWLAELAMIPEIVGMYSNMGVFPMHGESCFNYFSDCEYFGTCSMTDKYLIPKLPDDFQEKAEKELVEKYQIHVSLEELIEAQLSKADMPQESEPDAPQTVHGLLEDDRLN